MQPNVLAGRQTRFLHARVLPESLKNSKPMLKQTDMSFLL